MVWEALVHGCTHSLELLRYGDRSSTIHAALEPIKVLMEWPVTPVPMAISLVLCPAVLSGNHDLYMCRTHAFETPATFHIVEKSHLTVQWFIQANQKTSSWPLLINIDVTLSIECGAFKTRASAIIFKRSFGVKAFAKALCLLNHCGSVAS